MTDEPKNQEPSFSTSDIFKKSKSEVENERLKAELEKYTGEGYVRPEKEDVGAALEDLTDRMTKLVHNRKDRNQIEQWDNLLFDLKDAGFENSHYFSKRLHRALLKAFGYKDKYLRRPRPLKNPPIRPGVISFIFDKMGWENQRVSQKTYRQRQWIEVRTGLRETTQRALKVKKNNGCIFWAIIFFVLIVMFT